MGELGRVGNLVGSGDLIDEGEEPTAEDLVMWYLDLREPNLETFAQARALQQEVDKLVEDMVGGGIFDRTEKFDFKSEESRDPQDEFARVLRLGMHWGLMVTWLTLMSLTRCRSKVNPMLNWMTKHRSNLNRLKKNQSMRHR